ncbi:MAG: hypothetical protein HY925_15135 [Elusimicrobia bacterium]|nr:hypothetical protein [Elusimicrobiota bacterium]
MRLTRRWMEAAVLTAALTAPAFAADHAGRMLRNAESAAGIFQAGLASGASLEDTAARGFEGQQALLGFGSGESEAGGVDASGAKSKSGFAVFAERHQGAVKISDVPAPKGWDCHGPGCGGNGGNGGEKGRRIGETTGRLAGLAMSFLGGGAAFGLVFNGILGIATGGFSMALLSGISLGAAAIAGTWGGRPEGDSLLARIASSPICNGMAKIGGFAGEWTGRGASFVAGLFRRS